MDFELADKFGYSSPFNGSNQSEQLTYYREAVKADKLIKDLASKPSLLDFDYKDYQAEYTIDENSGIIGADDHVEYRKYTPFEYHNSLGQIVKASFWFDLCTENGKIDLETDFNFTIDLDPDEESVVYCIHVPYYQDFGSFQKPPDAIRIYTHSFEDIIHFNKIQRGRSTKGPLKKVADEFKTQLSKYANDAPKLKWLCEEAPAFALSQLSDKTLFKYFNSLIKYDTSSWFKDASQAAVKCLSAMENSVDAWYKLLTEKEKVINNYRAMNGESEYNGVLYRSKIAYASVLTAICLINGQVDGGGMYQIDGDEAPNPGIDGGLSAASFRSFGDYSIGSIKSEDGFDNNGLITLIQYRTITSTVEVMHGSPDGPEFETITNKSATAIKTLKLHPLQPIIIDDGEKPYWTIALMAKAWADEETRQDLLILMRIGFDLLAVAFAILTIELGGAGGWLVLAVADLLIFGGDIFMQLLRKEMEARNDKSLDDLFEIWEKVYAIGSIATAVVTAPALAASFARAATVAYRSASAGLRGGIRSMLVVYALERGILNFSRSSVLVLHTAQDIQLASKGVLQSNRMQRLMDEGVVFMLGDDLLTGERTFAVLYEGEMIMQGTAKEVREVMASLIGKRGKGLRKALIEASRKAAGSGDATKSFFANARVSIIETVSDGVVYGQSFDYSCVATSLKMGLEDFNKILSEDYLIGLTQTTTRATRTEKPGAIILDIPKHLNDNYLEAFNAKAFGGTGNRTTVDDLIEQLATSDKRAIVSVATDEFGAHAVLVEKIKNGAVFIRDPLPMNAGSSYSVSIEDFTRYFNYKFVTLDRPMP